MSIDLMSVRFLVVLGSQQDRDLLRQAAGIGAVPIDIVEAENPGAARNILDAQDIDIVLLDFVIPAEERAAIFEAARAARQRPFVFLVAARWEAGDRTAADGASDGLLVAPTTSEEAGAIIKRCSRPRIPGRVLVVDDSSTMRSIVRKILSASRFRLDVFEAQEGIEALKQIGAGNFDLVILDYNMPGLNGLETLSEIKRQYPKTGVIMMSSDQDEEIAERAWEIGAVAFLWKPFYPADIDVVLHRVYGLRAPQRSSV